VRTHSIAPQQMPAAPHVACDRFHSKRRALRQGLSVEVDRLPVGLSQSDARTQNGFGRPIDINLMSNFWRTQQKCRIADIVMTHDEQQARGYLVMQRMWTAGGTGHGVPCDGQFGTSKRDEATPAVGREASG